MNTVRDVIQFARYCRVDIPFIIPMLCQRQELLPVIQKGNFMPLSCLLYIPDSGSTQGEFLMHCSYLICIAIIGLSFNSGYAC